LRLEKCSRYKSNNSKYRTKADAAIIATAIKIKVLLKYNKKTLPYLLMSEFVRCYRGNVCSKLFFIDRISDVLTYTI